MPSSNGVPNGSACIQTLEAPAAPPDQWLGSARIGGAIGRMTLALTLALCKTRMYPLCTHREVLVWVTGVVAGAF